MAALDRLDELEEFLLGLRPEETFRRTGSGVCRCSARTTTSCPARSRTGSASRPSWRDELARAQREVVVARHRHHAWTTPALERAYSSRTTEPDELAQARARLRGDVRPRAAARRRRPRGDGRRLGAELPARLRVRPAGGEAHRRLPLRAPVPAGRRRDGRRRRAAAPLPATARGARPARRARAGGAARGPRRAGAHARHLRPPLACRHPAQHRARGAAGGRARPLDRRAGALREDVLALVEQPAARAAVEARFAAAASRSATTASSLASPWSAAPGTAASNTASGRRSRGRAR